MIDNELRHCGQIAILKMAADDLEFGRRRTAMAGTGARTVPVRTTLDSSPAGRSHQPDAAGEQRLRHALLEQAGLGEAGFQGGDFGVDVGEGGGDGGLLLS